MHNSCGMSRSYTKLQIFFFSLFAQSKRSSRLVFTFLLLLNCAMAQPLMAATYYVSKTGIDTNPGTESLPWLTIQKAANTIVAGDTVYVQSGIYSEKVNCTAASGTEDKSITFLANGSVTIYGWYLSKPYYTVQGFTVTGETVPSYWGSFSIAKTAHGTKIINNTITHNSSLSNVYGIFMQADSSNYGINPYNCTIKGNNIIEPVFHALSLQGSGHLVENNYFTGTKGWDAIRLLSSNTIIRGNTFDNWSNLINNGNHPDIIQAFADNGEIVINVIVENNFAKNCVNTQIGNITDTYKVPTGNVGYWEWRNNIFANVAWAMSIYADNFKFYNNVFYKCGINTSSPILFRSSTDRGVAHNSKIFNNIFVECGSMPTSPYYGWYGTYVPTDAPALQGFEADFNLVIGTGDGTTKKGFNEPHGLNGTQPRFLDPDRLDFRPIVGSPVIGAAKNLYPLFATDFTGAMRDSSLPWDLGAFVYLPGKPTQPATPQNLRISLE